MYTANFNIAWDTIILYYTALDLIPNSFFIRRYRVSIAHCLLFLQLYRSYKQRSRSVVKIYKCTFTITWFGGGIQPPKPLKRIHRQMYYVYSIFLGMYGFLSVLIPKHTSTCPPIIHFWNVNKQHHYIHIILMIR